MDILIIVVICLAVGFFSGRLSAGKSM